jgi:predicted RNase H-like nuclease (RuvC/YqgF family)
MGGRKRLKKKTPQTKTRLHREIKQLQERNEGLKKELAANLEKIKALEKKL